MTLDDRTLEAIEASNTDALLRIVDGICTAREWDRLDLLRRHCRAAVERGKQLWSIDEHARYRIALEAPAPLAAAAVLEGPGRFMLGPLPEVAACRHRWEELAPVLTSEPERALVAHECVIRGADLRESDFDRLVLELPPTLQRWEPRYAPAEYYGDRAEFPTPDSPRFSAIADVTAAPPISESPEGEALAALVHHWVERSNGRVQTAAVDGTAEQAIGALGAPRVAVADIDPGDAMAWMAWAAASGGAHGPRRGAAAGRFEAWWTASTLANVPWPPEPAELGQAVSELRWLLWTDGSSEGWNLRLAIEDPDDGVAWAIAAVDASITEERIHGGT